MIIKADARHIPLRDGCVQCVVTSLPYFGLRDYENPQQLGLEATPDAYVAALVAVFAEVWRVLKDNGTVWLNLGDSYAGSCGARGRGPDTNAPRPDLEAKYGTATPTRHVFRPGNPAKNHGNSNRDGLGPVSGCKPKELIGIPWRLAFALQADGWYLRSDIIWHKPNPMPESVTDRPTKSHEYLFLLAKSERYYYDADAIREPLQECSVDRVKSGWKTNRLNVSGSLARGETTHTAMTVMGLRFAPEAGRNKRSVWTIPTMPYSGAHFATFPEALVEPCILAGSRIAGRRCDCEEIILTLNGHGDVDDPTIRTGRAGFNRPRRSDEGVHPITRREQRDYAQQLRDSPHRDQMSQEAGSAFEHYVRTDRRARDRRRRSWCTRGAREGGSIPRRRVHTRSTPPIWCWILFWAVGQLAPSQSGSAGAGSELILVISN